MIYDLWDIESGNRIGTYQSEVQALEVVRGLLAVNAPDYAEALSLSHHDGRGNGKRVAQGIALAERAAYSPR